MEFVILKWIIEIKVLLILRIYLFIMRNLNILGNFDKWIFQMVFNLFIVNWCVYVGFRVDYLKLKVVN